VSVGDLASVGTAEAYGWPSGVAGLPEQARGTASRRERQVRLFHNRTLLLVP